MDDGSLIEQLLSRHVHLEFGFLQDIHGVAGVERAAECRNEYSRHFYARGKLFRVRTFADRSSTSVFLDVEDDLSYWPLWTSLRAVLAERTT